MSPRWTSISPVRSAGQRSWIRPGAVDEVEEGELPHLAAREHAPGEPALVGRPRRPARAPSASARTAAISSRSGKRFAAIGAGSLVPLQGAAPHHPGCGPSSRRPALAGRPRSRGARRRPGSLVVREQRAGDAGSRFDGVEPGLHQRGADAVPLPAGSTPMPARYQCGSGRRQPASPRRRARRRGSARSPRAPAAASRRAPAASGRRGSAAARAAASARSRAIPPSVVQTSASVTLEADPEEPRQKRGPPARRSAAPSSQAGSSWNARASTADASPTCSGSSRTISIRRR